MSWNIKKFDIYQAKRKISTYPPKQKLYMAYSLYSTAKQKN